MNVFFPSEDNIPPCGNSSKQTAMSVPDSDDDDILQLTQDINWSDGI